MKTPCNFSVSACHPVKQLVTLAAARGWSAGDFLIQRKYDGELAALDIGGAVVLVESMRGEISGHFYTAADRSMFARHPGGWFAALTVAAVNGQSVLHLSTSARWGLLAALNLPANVIRAAVVTEAAAALLAGAEGVCAHGWGDVWGNMLCHKASEIHFCRVTGFAGGTQSVTIADAATGEPRGRVALRGGKCDRVRVGSIIRVEAMGMTAAGKLRQPNPCREWLVQF